MILLDTHALIWLATESGQLGKRSSVLAREAWAQGRLAVSAISFWELAMIHARKRVMLAAAPAEMRNILLATGVIELPIDGYIATLAVQLEGLHKDPADRFIAATAVMHKATLVTADARLLGWKHALKLQNATK